MIAGAVMDDNVHHDFQPACMRSFNQIHEVFHRAVSRIYSIIVPDGIRTSQRSFAAFNADRMNRQQIDIIKAHLSDVRKLFRNIVQVSMRTEVPRENLINRNWFHRFSLFF